MSGYGVTSPMLLRSNRRITRNITVRNKTKKDTPPQLDPLPAEDITEQMGDTIEEFEKYLDTMLPSDEEDTKEEESQEEPLKSTEADTIGKEEQQKGLKKQLLLLLLIQCLAIVIFPLSCFCLEICKN